jgi:hypothetical protein
VEVPQLANGGVEGGSWVARTAVPLPARAVAWAVRSIEPGLRIPSPLLAPIADFSLDVCIISQLVQR